jgi:hypothetical protein
MNHLIDRASLVQRSQESKVPAPIREAGGRGGCPVESLDTGSPMERMPAEPPACCARQDTAHGVSSKCAHWPVSGCHKK